MFLFHISLSLSLCLSVCLSQSTEKMSLGEGRFKKENPATPGLHMPSREVGGGPSLTFFLLTRYIHLLSNQGFGSS